MTLLFGEKDAGSEHQVPRGMQGVKRRIASVRSLTRTARPYEKWSGATRMQLSYPVQKRGREAQEDTDSYDILKSGFEGAGGEGWVKARPL
jgi:hypothetical protein